MVHHTHARTPILSLVTQMLLFKERKKSKKKPLAKWRRRPIFIAVQYSFFIIVIGVVHKILLPLTLDCLNCIQFLCGCFSSNTTIFPSSSSPFFLLSNAADFFGLSDSQAPINCVAYVFACVFARINVEGLKAAQRIFAQIEHIRIHWNVSKQFHLLSLVLDQSFLLLLQFIRQMLLLMLVYLATVQ